ncbi:LOW QUALITY PROTEIN: adhesion G protein-coupled receptor E5-like, partial [Osmerus eperlanus]|uniref:LOW QUALITY PROTEIN: adhesion G protein-coupled receptor E5-like n=1 Tax=Osmerus eperlanus TaxID=29151 RepID=UPI002E15C805
CLDYDECADNTEHCGRNKQCFNTNGSFNCMCKSGFEPSTLNNSKTDDCQDKNECYENKTLCGPEEGGACHNTHGRYWCQCKPGYSNYGNNQSMCTELKCDQFKDDADQDQALPGLSAFLSQLQSSCLGMTGSGSPGRTGEVLLENLFTATDEMLSPGHLGNRVKASRLLSTMENAVRFIVPQLHDNHTRMETEHTEAEIELKRSRTPPTGMILLTNQNAGLKTSWEIARNRTYQGFAFAALVSYKNLSQSLNNNDSFENLDDDHPEPDENRRPSYQVASSVVTVVVSNTDTKKLDQNVSITLRRLEEGKESEDRKFTCVFWEEGGPGHEGAWSRRGCSTAKSNVTHTACTCSHLSSFAVLMALYPVEHTLQLVLLTRVGLAVSLVCLALSIATFALCLSLQGTRNTIHLHACICLFLADLVFITGISRTEPQWGCSLVAGLLHLFFLCSFCWMLLEGVQLYRMVVQVFNTSVRPLHLHAVGYGLPLLVVTVSAISRPHGYGTKQYCWLSLEHGLMWSFFGPVCTIVFVNVIFFLVTMWRLAQKFTSLNPEVSQLRKIRVFTLTAAAQLCVLGVMWMLGALLFQDHGSPALLYLFTAFNSLQGALFFILHCLLSKQVREEYSNFLSCICTPKKKRYSDLSTTNPSSQSQGLQSHHTGESQI